MYRIYRNLHDQSWTVQHKVPGKGWRKKEACKAIWAAQVDFKVYESGRDRCRREGKKYVHAYAIVDKYMPLSQTTATALYDGGIYGVVYNPYNDRGFTTVDGGGRNLASATGCTFASFGHIGTSSYKEQS